MTDSQRSESAEPSEPSVRRESLIGQGGAWLARWSLVFLAIAAATIVLGLALAHIWVIVLPVIMAVVVATVLWPPTRWLRERGLRPSLAASVTLLTFLALIGGVVALIVPSVSEQVPELANKASDGIDQVQNWLAGPPLNIDSSQIDDATASIVRTLQDSSSAIASGVFSGVSAAGSFLVTTVLVLVLAFFFIKDGTRFLPWLHGVTGRTAGRHLTEILDRMWISLGSFVRTQALVSLIDAIFIGIGLVILGVPLAPVLITITFIGGFIPIVGAFVAGALAVLVALVANGFTTALIVLAIIIVVQQVEGNVLQPILQSKSTNLHAVVVLLAVTAGGSLFGIVGAFLAVPAASAAAVVFRYVHARIDERTGVTTADAGAGEHREGTAGADEKDRVVVEPDDPSREP